MDLQSLCIDKIVSNFEGYFSTFSNSKDAVHKQEFEFLQRKFSYEIASELYERSKLKKKYIDFFINKHLKILDFHWLKEYSWKKIVAKFQEIGPGLQTLQFRGDYHRGMPLQDLMRYLPNLQVLKFHKYCTNEILKTVGQFCDNILEIEIYSSDNVTSEGIKHLCTKEDGRSTGLKLRKLSIGYSSDVREGIAYLIRHMPSIEILGYMFLMDLLYSMHMDDLWEIDKMQPYNLQKLDFLLIGSSGSALFKLLKISASLCPRVKYLRYFLNTEEDLKFICGFRNLQYLYLQKPVNSEVEVSQLLELIGGQLLFLGLENVSISDITLANTCPLLKEMVLSLVNLKIDGFQSPLFSVLEKVTFLVFDDAKSVETIRHIFRFSPKLEDISFSQYDFQCGLLLKAEVLKCVKNPIKKITFIGTFEKTFIQDILLTCHSLKSITLKTTQLKDKDKFKIKKTAQTLPNRPKVVFVYPSFCDEGFCEHSKLFSKFSP